MRFSTARGPLRHTALRPWTQTKRQVFHDHATLFRIQQAQRTASGHQRRTGLFWFTISPLVTEPRENGNAQNRPLPRYLLEPDLILGPIWALPDRSLLALSDPENRPPAPASQDLHGAVPAILPSHAVEHTEHMSKRQSPSSHQLPVAVELIERRIFSIRGRRVMLDRDLADIYGVSTKRLNGRGESDLRFKVAICDLEQRSKPQVCSLCLQGAWGGHGGQCSQ